MKKLIFVLTIVVFMFVSGSTFGATIQCHMDNASQSLVWGQMPGEFYFQITTDDITDDIVSVNGLFPYWSSEEAGGWNTDDNASFALNEQVYKTANTYDMSTIYFTSAIQAPGNGHWFRGTSPFDSNMYDIGIRETTVQGVTFYDPITGSGQFMVGSLVLAETYNFSAVPIPSAIWLLGSGLIGLVGFRRKIRKV